MPHFKIILAYDGTPYHGWQIQPGLSTVQGALAEALRRITHEIVLPQGSGRTDTGVHALAQVASVTLAAPIPADRLHRALNHALPNSIRAISVENAPPSFHARHSAVSKIYEYRIFPLRLPFESQPVDGESDFDTAGELFETTAAICPPTLAPFVWPCPWPLSLDALNAAASNVLGTHDFTTFAAAPSTEENAPATYVRTITHSHWFHKDGLIYYRVAANGFLHHMVRNLVGTFVQCGARRRAPSSIPDILQARNRARSGPTAPASGLFLVSVDYPPFDPRSISPPD
ncbi:MAG TPA: tRNA pseudouridine(38-40) synthase TruA [Acidobacteriaceae bacterium]|nr:tRNA pseudouridine(38-40) synthase TruA [Acidobacteriaceae bacterium]